MLKIRLTDDLPICLEEGTCLPKGTVFSAFNKDEGRSCYYTDLGHSVLCVPFSFAEVLPNA